MAVRGAKSGVFVVLAALSSSCAITPRGSSQDATPDTLRARYDAHAADVQAHPDWSLSGRVSVSSDQDSWQATLLWQQEVGSFDVRLQGPLGQGSARLRSSQGYVVMDSSDGQRLIDSTAARLVQQRLGWSFPVEELRYWVRGVAAPGSDAAMEWSNAGQLERLQQNGWDVRYKSYVATGGLHLPSKLILEKSPWTVKLVVDEWTDVAAQGTM